MIATLAITLLAATSADTRAHVLIVANNASTDPTLATLRYADDDGAKYYELLSLMAPERTTLLSVLDQQTQRVFPKIASRALPPSRKELEKALDRTFRNILDDSKRGYRTVFYFVFVGHGSAGEDGEGSVHLLDGRFTRSDLFQRVIARSPASMNHLIIDACNAYLMIARRGDKAARSAAIENAVAAFLEKESLDRYPNTGVLASTSQAAEVHEWSRFEAGVFSHEVRSAMAGAADIDRDGLVTYAELRAFVSAANARVQDPKAKINAHAVAPPIHLNEPLFDRGLAPEAPTLQVPFAGRRWLEDDRGVRFADFHASEDGALTFVLVPASTYFLRSDEDEIKIPLDVVKSADASQLTREPLALATRGSEELAFRRDLFAVPYGRAYFEGYLDAQPHMVAETPIAPREDERPSLHKVLSLSTAGAALASAATGIGFGLAAKSAADDFRTASGSNDEIAAFKTKSESRAATANVFYAVSGALFAGAITLWLVPF